MLLTPVFGRVAGVFIAFLVPFLDVGVGQSPMLRVEQAAWADYRPSYGAYGLLLDGGITAGFDAAQPLVVARGWLAVVATTATLGARRAIVPAGA